MEEIIIIFLIQLLAVLGMNKIVEHSEEEIDAEILPNVLHRWTNVTDLNLTLSTISNKSYSAEYMIELTTAESGEINLNIEGVTWSGGVPELVNNKTYQISIMNNLAVIAQF